MRWYLLALLIFGHQVFAQGVQPAVAANYKDANDLKGLCTSRDNKKEPYFESGYCLTILEQLQNNECTKKMVEELRLRILNDKVKMDAAKIKNQNGMSLGMSCQGKNSTPERAQDVDEIANDREKFNILLMNLFAATIIQESNWKALNGGSNSQANSPRCDSARCGLLGLNAADMNKATYKCGCDIKNKTDDGKQFDPTMDPHLNLRCGVTMAIKDAMDNKDEDDPTLVGGGKPKDKNQTQDTRSGMAKKIRALQEEDGERKNTPRGKIEKKFETYCEVEAFSRGHVNEWKTELDKNPIGLDGKGNTTR